MDPVTTPSEIPKQPAVETPVVATAAPTVPESTSHPTTETPPTTAAPEAAAPTPAVTPPVAETPAAVTPATVPETYEITLPEAFKGQQLDPALIPALTPALKQAGLTQAQLQTVAQSFLEFQAGLPARMLERDMAIVAKDPEIGGMKYGQTVKDVGLALDAFADPEFKSFVAQAGIGNRLEFVRVFQRIGQAMRLSGDTPSRGQPDSAPTLTRAERMYGRRTQP